MEFIYNLHWYLSKKREHPGIHERLRDIRDECGLTIHEWTELRNRRLRQILTFSGHHVPYYRRVFEQTGMAPDFANLPKDMRRIPILTKSVFLEHQEELRAETAKVPTVFENATGGSTGVPLKFFQDQNYHTTAAALDAYVREWWGIQPYDRTAFIWGADREFHQLSIKERLYEWRARSRSLNAFRMTDESLLKFCRMLMRWHPPYLMGYSSALEMLAKCALNHGIHNLRFKAIRSSAEMLWPHQRQTIAAAFGSPVYNFYGSREVNNLAAECPEEGRMHLISSWRYIEILDEEGQPVPDGELGYIVITDLSNYTMPFIRYRNEDMGSIAKEPCLCRRPTPVLEKLLGRSTDLIRTPQGEIIHGEFFTHLFYGCNNIRQFQVHQNALDRLVIRCVPKGELCEEPIKEIVNRIHERLGPDVTVEVKVCNEIPVPASGKHRFTISDVNGMDLKSIKK